MNNSRRTAAVLVLLAAAVAALGLAAVSAAAPATPAPAAATPVASSACGPLVYGGAGSPQAIVVSDLPLQGDSKRRSQQQNDTIELVLAGSGWHAGGTAVGFQACDDSEADTGLWSVSQCKSNAQAYAADPSVLGVIGTYNSGCAETMLPILSAAPGGGLGMISPGNTAVCLTQENIECLKGPKQFYPGGQNYARVVPNDAYQGAALAKFAKSKGSKRVYVLHGGDRTSYLQGFAFRGAAEKLGIDVVGFRSYDVGVSSFKPLFKKVAAAKPDAVVVAGLIEQNGSRLIKEKVQYLGSNAAVPLFAFDGFAQQSTIKLSGAAAKGMYVSVPGLAPSHLKGPGKKLVKQLQAKSSGPVEPFAPYAGQAASIMLESIAASPQRAGVIKAMLAAKVTNGIIGSFSILPSGDPSVGPITVSVAKSSFVASKVIEPSQSLVKAALARAPHEKNE